MRNISRICTTTNIENKNWKKELKIFLRSFRATPHSSTGVPPHTALYGRAMRKKLPEAPPSFSTVEEMKIKDKQSKDEMKRYANHRRHAKPFNLGPNDQGLVHKGRFHQRKIEAYYEPRSYIVTDKKGSMVTVQDGKHSITRNYSMFKPFGLVTESVKIERDEKVQIILMASWNDPLIDLSSLGNKIKPLKKEAPEPQGDNYQKRLKTFYWIAKRHCVKPFTR